MAYVYSWNPLIFYHRLVIREMLSRGYKPDLHWVEFLYRGKFREELDPSFVNEGNFVRDFPQHNPDYLLLCIGLLNERLKGAEKGKYNGEEIKKLRDFKIGAK